MGSGYYLELWSLSATRTSRDGRIKPHLEFNTPGGSFNFKDVDWGQFSNLIAQGFMNLKLDVNKSRGKAKRHPNTETQTRAKECSEEFPTEMSEAKRKYWNDFLSSRNSSNIWDVPAYVKEKQSRTVVSQLTRKGGTTTKELTEIIDYFFQELIPLAPSSGSLCTPPIPMKDARWPRLEVSENGQALYQRAPLVQTALKLLQSENFGKSKFVKELPLAICANVLVLDITRRLSVKVLSPNLLIQLFGESTWENGSNENNIADS